MAVEVATDCHMFIDGAPAESSSGEWLEVHSPATGELIGRAPAGTEADVDRGVAAARAARDGRWRSMLMGDRVAVLNRLAELIDANADDLARLETQQTGSAYKLRRDSDLVFASDNLRFFAGQIRHLEGKAAYEYSGSHTSFVRREPIGVVGQVAPWNYPLWMAIWKVGPALAAGNSVVLKPASFGHVQVNDHLMVTSEMPHGGFKQSGFGKDMSSYSFEEYTRVKHVMIELTGEPEKAWHYTIFGDKPT